MQKSSMRRVPVERPVSEIVTAAFVSVPDGAVFFQLRYHASLVSGNVRIVQPDCAARTTDAVTLPMMMFSVPSHELSRLNRMLANNGTFGSHFSCMSVNDCVMLAFVLNRSEREVCACGLSR